MSRSSDKSVLKLTSQICLRMLLGVCFCCGQGVQTRCLGEKTETWHNWHWVIRAGSWRLTFRLSFKRSQGSWRTESACQPFTKGLAKLVSLSFQIYSPIANDCSDSAIVMKRDYPCSNMIEKLCALRPQLQVRDKPTEIQCALGSSQQVASCHIFCYDVRSIWLFWDKALPPAGSQLFSTIQTPNRSWWQNCAAIWAVPLAERTLQIPQG